MWRIVRLSAFALLCTLCLCVCMMLPDLVRYLPRVIRKHGIEELAIACLTAYAIARWVAARASAGSQSGAWARAGLRILDIFTAWAMRGGGALALGLFCAGLLLAWFPHYLTWPWIRDHETFAVLAQSWDQGILPYRDIRAYNFPGAIYLAWALGKIFGWGHTVPLYAFDTACVFLLGVVLAAWSQRRLGGAVPGLVGYLAFLAHYLDLSYEYVAQRDWHTALLLCLGILVMQAWPGRSSRMVSALLAALALVIRPHAVLFLPALLWEVAQGVDGSERSRSKRIRELFVWCLSFGAFVALAFAPLLLAGIADDLARGLRIAAYGGPYSKTTHGDVIHMFAGQFLPWRTNLPLVATLLLAAKRRDRLSEIARTWSWVWLGALLYLPIHPVHHYYLQLPIYLVSSITWALAVSWLLSAQRLARPVLIVAIALLAYEIMCDSARTCRFVDSVRALGPLYRCEIPTMAPIGCHRPYPRYRGGNENWTNYRDLLNYLSNNVGPRTLVANVINRFPYETINGPIGRLSPFRAESGICWMVLVDIDLDAEFAQSLIDSTDSVVVWDPSQNEADPRLKLERLVRAIWHYYEPAARFGRFEVWRRKPEVDRPLPGRPADRSLPRTE